MVFLSKGRKKDVGWLVALVVVVVGHRKGLELWPIKPKPNRNLKTKLLKFLVMAAAAGNDNFLRFVSRFLAEREREREEKSSRLQPQRSAADQETLYKKKN